MLNNYLPIVYIKHIIKLFIYNFIFALKLPYPKGLLYIFKIKIKKNLVPLIASEKFKEKKINKIYNKIFSMLKVAQDNNFDIPQLYLWTSIASLVLGKKDQWVNYRLEYIKKQSLITKKLHKKGNNFLIIEPGLILNTIGTIFNLDAWIKSRILGFQKNYKLILPVIPELKNKIINPSMISYLKPYVEIIEDPEKAKYYYSILDDYKCLYDEHIPCGDKIIPIAHSSGAYVQSIWDKEGRKPLFQLTDEHKEKGEATLRKMGLPSGAWFATCHVREPHYKDREDFRDSDITTFNDAFKEITKRGGWVIRMGDKSMKPLPDMPQVVDYAISEFKSDWMDVFLCASSKFMIGTSSGLSAINYIFGVPIAMTNLTPTMSAYLTKKDLFIPRLMQRLEDGRMLSLVELMTSPYSLGVNDGIYMHINKVKNNSQYKFGNKESHTRDA